MQRSEIRFLTTHTGSLIRPAALTEAPAADADAEARAGYERALTEAVAGVVVRQWDVGLDVVNDGEFGKSGWSGYALDRISGFEIRQDQLKPLDWLGRDRERFKDFFTDNPEMPLALTGAPTQVCVGPVEYTGHDFIARDLANLKAATAGHQDREVFCTSVAPASTAYNGVNEYYKTEEEYVYAIADALRQEYLAIHQAGFILQVDDAVLANMYDHLIQQGEEAYRRWAQLRIDALNHALAGIPEDRIRYHVCFGSWHVPHVADAPLEALTGLILQVNAGAYSIEAANPRHEWEWEVWERTKLPDGKILIPGVITHHTTTVEHPRLVAQRLERFAGIIGPENVIGGADCGFAQTSAIRRTHPEVVWAKFGSLVAGAQIASERIWGSRRRHGADNELHSIQGTDRDEPSDAEGGVTVTVGEQARADDKPDRGEPGVMAGKTPGVRETPPPGPGELQQTPQEIEGPFFRLGAPQRSSLLEPGDKPGVILSGRVLNERGTPIPGAVVNFWSSDLYGNYDMVGYRYTGYVVTDEAGRYEVTTIIPGYYQPRNARHIHVKLQAVSRPVTTQLYFEGEPGNTDDEYYHPALLVPCTVDDAGVKHGTYDFVIKQITEEENVTAESLAARVGP